MRSDFYEIDIKALRALAEVAGEPRMQATLGRSRADAGGPPLRHRSKNAARLNLSRAAAFQPREGVTQKPGEGDLAQVVPRFCVA